jgi:RHH-type transcriptional regulator, rel operon repressor / antitoxin RelB
MDSMSTLTINVSAEVERRIDELARKHGRRKDEFVLEAILQYLADQDDVELARHRLAEPGRRKTLFELEKELGLDG